jgi:hypothetical protein
MKKTKRVDALRPSYFDNRTLSLLFGWLDEDEFSHLAFVHELHRAGDLGEQGVVFTATDVNASLITRTALTDDDRSARNQLTAENLYAKPLCIRIAAVSGAT